MDYSVACDRKWQQRWADSGLNRFDEKRLDEKLYCLEMFSYPSGANLHAGHWFNFGLADSWARFKRMQGRAVFQPMGFDAFGLPAENYAIKTGIHPQDSTTANIARMESQLREMGGMFDWDYEVVTCDPEYYRWTQWLFLVLYRSGLAYRHNAPVNWCPDCNTVLANEQVIDGHCERCEAEVGKRNLTQWFFRITAYAQELLDCLPGLEWPDKTKKIQTNWIGRSEGAELVFGTELDGRPVLDENGKPLELTVFTTRTDTLYGVTYVVVAPESELCSRLTAPDRAADVVAYTERTRRLADVERMSTVREKTGVPLGSFAIHPLTGERVPIWAADYVIAGYGTGVVMAVPGHDDRDFAFASQFGLPIRRVILDADGTVQDLPFVDKGILTASGEYDGMTSEQAIAAILNRLEPQGRGRPRIQYRLRDWLVSRQRYWGAPIPIIHCPACGAVPVPEDQLPVLLPYDVEFKPDGESPLKKHAGFMNVRCPQCGEPAQRDPDTLDTFVCSSWYYLRYPDNRNRREAFDRERINRFCPVDMYVGGAEHAAMHLLYARFVTKALRDLKYLDFDEPFLALIHQGTILGADGQKMSKSRGNTVNPDDLIQQYGADAFRVYLAFGFAFSEGGPWNDDGVKSIARFLSRVEHLVDRFVERKAVGGTPQPGPDHAEADRELQYARHYAIAQVTADTERFSFNTSIARLMELLNAIGKYQQVAAGADTALLESVIGDLVLLLAPYAPHFGEEQWEKLGHTRSVFLESWPSADPRHLVRDTVEIVVQVNGAIKYRLEIPTALSAEDLEARVRADERTTAALMGRQLIRVISVPGRLINLVAR